MTDFKQWFEDAWRTGEIVAEYKHEARLAAETAWNAALASVRPEAPPTAELRDCWTFWQDYSKLNERAQDDIQNEKDLMLARMQAWVEAAERGAFMEAARNAVIEECALVCDKEADRYGDQDNEGAGRERGAELCAEAIRALKDKSGA